MTRQEAEALGYAVIAASSFEVGLIKGDKGIMTWFCQDFDRVLPPLDHPKIMRTIEVHEAILHGLSRMKGESYDAAYERTYGVGSVTEVPV